VNHYNDEGINDGQMSGRRNGVMYEQHYFTHRSLGYLARGKPGSPSDLRRRRQYAHMLVKRERGGGGGGGGKGGGEVVVVVAVVVVVV